MAESSDVQKSINMQNVLREILQLSSKYMELKKEMSDLEICEIVKGPNEKTDLLIEELLNIELALKFIIDNKTDHFKRLKSPLIPNAITLEYKLQESFVKCCKTIPHIINYMDTEQRKPKVPEGYDDYNLISNIEKEQLKAKQYISHGKRFQSEASDYERNIYKLIDLMKKTEE